MQRYRALVVTDSVTRKQSWVDHHKLVKDVDDKVANALGEKLHAVQTELGTVQPAKEGDALDTLLTSLGTDAEEDVTMVSCEFHADHVLPVAYLPSELPLHTEALKKVSAPVRKRLEFMWGTVHAWPSHPGVQLTFAQVGATAGEGFIAMRALLGETVWTRTYGDRAQQIKASDICPRNLATPLFLALAKAAEIMGAAEMETRVAESAKALLVLQADLGIQLTKKRKVAAASASSGGS
jgi:hypothetical protein